jgi:hypothetical protein
MIGMIFVYQFMEGSNFIEALILILKKDIQKK